MLLFLPLVLASEVPVSFLKVYPLTNPSETYRYYDIVPFCRPINQRNPWFLSFDRVLEGERPAPAPFNVTYGENQQTSVYCEASVTDDIVRDLKEAVSLGYVFDIEIAGLPITQVPLGRLDEDSHAFLLTVLNLKLGLNEDHIVSATLGDSLVDSSYQLITLEDPLRFRYSVTFTSSDILPSDARAAQLQRPDKYFTTPSAIHTVAATNAFILTVLTIALLVVVLVRAVRSDLGRFLPDTEMGSTEVDDIPGWKLLHADVFRPPPHRLVLCAAAGAGLQLAIMACLTVTAAFLNLTDSTGTSAVGFYMLSAFSGGFESGKWYRRLGGDKTAWNVLLTALLFAGPAFIAWAVLNTMALLHNSTAAFPFTTIIIFFSLWAGVTLPLTVLGGFAGARYASTRYFPGKTNRLAREIPRKKWWQSSVFQFLVSGFLPFSAMYIELNYLFDSAWGKGGHYRLYGPLCVGGVMATMIATASNLLFTYLQLNAEDHRWWWRCFISGGAVGLFFLGFCAWYYAKSAMHGILQGSFFALYSLLTAFAIHLMVGYASFLMSLRFVVFLYKRVKSE